LKHQSGDGGGGGGGGLVGEFNFRPKIHKFA